MPDSYSITIAVLTYLRPADIEESLPRLLDQARRYGPSAQVLVVDNDPNGSARSTVSKFAGDDLRYVVESTPGIAAARNRAIDESTSDLLVFIDDDERPSHDWLVNLVETFDRHRGTLGVAGLVESEFASPPDPWIIQGGFFERLNPSTGTMLEVVATNNLLLDRRVLSATRLRFDEQFGLSGGSDTMFSHEARRLGLSFRFCREALVYDAVPAERMSREWSKKRWYRIGNSWSRTNIAAESNPAARSLLRVKLTFGGLVRIGAGAAFVAFGKVFQSLKWHANGWRILSRGAGLTAGAWGHAYAEYARPSSR